MTKLTLSVDEKVVEQAKRLARRNRSSVSAMFSEFIRAAAQQGDGPRRAAIGPIARQATGLVSRPKRKSDRQVLQDALLDKYGLKP